MKTKKALARSLLVALCAAMLGTAAFAVNETMIPVCAQAPEGVGSALHLGMDR